MLIGSPGTLHYVGTVQCLANGWLWLLPFVKKLYMYLTNLVNFPNDCVCLAKCYLKSKDLEHRNEKTKPKPSQAPRHHRTGVTGVWTPDNPGKYHVTAQRKVPRIRVTCSATQNKANIKTHVFLSMTEIMSL